MTHIRPGDIVRCKADYYQSYDYGDEARVLELDGSCFILPNYLRTQGVGRYHRSNWEFVRRPLKIEDNLPMAQNNPARKSEYFGIKLDPKSKGETFVHISDDTENVTARRELKVDAIKDVQQHIQEGERWIVVHAVALIEPSEPVVPTKVTHLY